MSYEVRANEKGEIGEALVAAGIRRRSYPNPFRRFVRRELGVSDIVLRVERCDGIVTPNWNRWTPDLRVVVSETPWNPVQTYFVEVKTGEYAELERSQREAMRDVTEMYREDAVLGRVRVDKFPNWDAEFEVVRRRSERATPTFER